MINFEENHILPIRTIISIFLVLVITSILKIPGHWGIIAVVSTSLGNHTQDIIKRSYILVSATIIGCILGTCLVSLLQFLSVSFLYNNALVMLIAIVTLYFNITNYYLGVGFNSIFIIMLSAINHDLQIGPKLIIIRSIDIGIGAFAFLLTSFYIKRNRLYKELCDQMHNLYEEHLNFLENIALQKELIQKLQLDVDILESKKTSVEKILFDVSIELSAQQNIAFQELLELMEDLTIFYSSVQNFMRLYNASIEISNFYNQKIDLFLILLKKKYAALKESLIV